jgi:hypothetical protein
VGVPTFELRNVLFDPVAEGVAAEEPPDAEVEGVPNIFTLPGVAKPVVLDTPLAAPLPRPGLLKNDDVVAEVAASGVDVRGAVNGLPLVDDRGPIGP